MYRLIIPLLHFIDLYNYLQNVTIFLRKIPAYDIYCFFFTKLLNKKLYQQLPIQIQEPLNIPQ